MIFVSRKSGGLSRSQFTTRVVRSDANLSFKTLPNQAISYSCKSWFSTPCLATSIHGSVLHDDPYSLAYNGLAYLTQYPGPPPVSQVFDQDYLCHLSLRLTCANRRKTYFGSKGSHPRPSIFVQRCTEACTGGSHPGTSAPAECHSLREISDIESKFSAIQKILRRMIARRHTLCNEGTLRRLPPEIIGEIFLCLAPALASDHRFSLERGYDEPHLTSEIPRHLGHICSYWRTVPFFIPAIVARFRYTAHLFQVGDP